jgi:polar amino acid transport system substrate-binding protein
MFGLARVFCLPPILGLALLAVPALADSLENIRARGELAAGVKADFPPFGFLDKDGQLVGIEPDLAADLARRLGVKLRLEPVLPANRDQMLRENKVDLIIATTVITREREKVMAFIDPPYYAAAYGGLALPAAGIQSEADLKGKAVCAIKGNFFNADLQSIYVQKDLVLFDKTVDAERALIEGRCEVFVFSHALLLSLKNAGAEKEKWKNYELIEFTEVDPRPWGIAVKPEERRSTFSKFISETILDWHRSGWLADIEKKWLGVNTPWVVGIREKYRHRQEPAVR